VGIKMKNQTIKQIEPFYNKEGLNRENSITLTIDEYTYEPRKKPVESVIINLKAQKKQILKAKKEDIEKPIKTIEYSIGTLANKKYRNKNRKNQINEIVNLLGELQKKYNYENINKKFINNLLSSLKPNSKGRILKLILNKAKEKKERTITKTYLVGEYNYEKKFKGEKTTSKKYPIDKIYVEQNKVVEFFNFK